MWGWPYEVDLPYKGVDLMGVDPLIHGGAISHGDLRRWGSTMGLTSMAIPFKNDDFNNIFFQKIKSVKAYLYF